MSPSFDCVYHLDTFGNELIFLIRKVKIKTMKLNIAAIMDERVSLSNNEERSIKIKTASTMLKNIRVIPFTKIPNITPKTNAAKR